MEQIITDQEDGGAATEGVEILDKVDAEKQSNLAYAISLTEKFPGAAEIRKDDYGGETVVLKRGDSGMIVMTEDGAFMVSGNIANEKRVVWPYLTRGYDKAASKETPLSPTGIHLDLIEEGVSFDISRIDLNQEGAKFRMESAFEAERREKTV